MLQFSARPALIAYATASRFSTGSVPGSPMHTGHTCVLGSAPNLVLQPHHTFASVSSSAWISSPMTTSYSVTGFTIVSVAIDVNLLARPPGPAGACRPRQLLVRVRRLQHLRVAEGRADELQPDRQPVRAHAAGHGQRRQPRQVHGHGANVGRVRLHLAAHPAAQRKGSG